LKADKKIILTLFLVVFVVGLVLRFSAFQFPLYDDDGIWGFAVRTENPLNLCTEFHYHPPLGPWIFQYHAALFGDGPAALRSVPVFYGLLTLILLYRFACRLFDRETGLIAVLLFLFCQAPYFTAVTIDAENSAYLFLATLCFYLMFLHIENPGRRRWLIICAMGLITGLMLLIKMTACFMYPALGLCLLVYGKKIIPAVRDTAVIVLIGAAVFSLYPVLVYIHYGDLSILQPIWDSVGSNVSLLAGLKGKGHILFVYLTPLLILFPLMEATYAGRKKWILYIWLGTFLACNVLLVHRLIPRYYSILAPPAVMLTAAFIRRCEPGLRTWLTVLLVAAAATAGLFYLNGILIADAGEVFYFQFSKSPVHDFIGYIYSLMMILGAVTLLCMIINRGGEIFSGAEKNPGMKGLLFPLLFSSLLAFNLFFVLNCFTYGPHREAIVFLQHYTEDHDPPKPFCAWNEDIAYYVGLKGFWAQHQRVYGGGPDPEKEFVDLEGDPAQILNFLYERGGTALLLNYPPCKQTGPVHPYLSALCRKEAEFRAGGHPLAQVYSAHPGDTRFLVSAARYLMKTKNFARALETWRQLLEDAPDHAVARRMIQRMTGREPEE
jgi:hypothetical protein